MVRGEDAGRVGVGVRGWCQRGKEENGGRSGSTVRCDLNAIALARSLAVQSRLPPRTESSAAVSSQPAKLQRHSLCLRS